MPFSTTVRKDESIPSNNYAPIPENEYHMTIDKCEEKLTKDGKNSYINFALKVTDGQYAGRKVFHRIIISFNGYTDSTVREINGRKLNEILDACLIDEARGPEDFVGKEMTVKVGFDKSGENEVKRLRPMAQVTLPSAPASAPSPAAPVGPANPFKR